MLRYLEKGIVREISRSFGWRVNDILMVSMLRRDQKERRKEKRNTRKGSETLLGYLEGIGVGIILRSVGLSW